MPIDPITGAAVIGAIGAAGSAAATGNANRKNRNFRREMYQRTYDDQVRFWSMQNEYNDPSAQMERLEKAGINPHSIAGNTQATGNAGSIGSPHAESYQHQAPDYKPLGDVARSYIHDIADLDIKKAQADNLKTDNTNKIKQGLLMDVQYGSQKFDYKFKRKLENINADILRQQLLNSQTDRELSLRKDDREAAMTGANLAESMERVLLSRERRATSVVERKRIRAQIRNLNKDTELKRLSIELRQMGIESNDAWYFRVLARQLNRITDFSFNRNDSPNVSKRGKYPLLHWDKNIFPDK